MLYTMDNEPKKGYEMELELGFSGYHTHQMDDKGRIRIPPIFRRKLGDHPIIFCNSFEKCLWIYTDVEFKKKIIDRFDGSDVLNKKMNIIQRAIFSSTQELVEDKQGRVSLNSAFIETCGFEKDLISIGVDDHVEVWSEAAYKEYLAKTDLDDILSQIIL